MCPEVGAGRGAGARTGRAAGAGRGAGSGRAAGGTAGGTRRSPSAGPLTRAGPPAEGVRGVRGPAAAGRSSAPPGGVTAGPGRSPGREPPADGARAGRGTVVRAGPPAARGRARPVRGSAAGTGRAPASGAPACGRPAEEPGAGTGAGRGDGAPVVPCARAAGGRGRSGPWALTGGAADGGGAVDEGEGDGGGTVRAGIRDGGSDGGRSASVIRETGVCPASASPSGSAGVAGPDGTGRGTGARPAPVVIRPPVPLCHPCRPDLPTRRRRRAGARTVLADQARSRSCVRHSTGWSGPRGYTRESPGRSAQIIPCRALIRSGKLGP